MPIIEATWKPSKIHGKDGVAYWVFTLYGAGRGWYSRQYYTPYDSQYVEIPVLVLEHSTAPNFRPKKGIDVKLHEQLDLELVPFARNPYVKKDGSFEHKKIWRRPATNEVVSIELLRKLYGVHHYTKAPTATQNYRFWPEEMQTLYQDAYVYLDTFEEVYIAEIEKSQIHAR